MDELVFLKLGGSLITEKNDQQSARIETLQRLAQEIAAARRQNPGLHLLVGHGSGSFGHPAAHRYQVHRGNLEDWYGYAVTSSMVQQLDRLVVEALLQADVPAVPVQPSASAICNSGQLKYLQSDVISALLEHSAVPVVYGDVAIDTTQGCTIISTEQLFNFLVPHLQPQRIILAGRVAGVYEADPLQKPQAQLLPVLDRSTFTALGNSLGGAGSIDVTGGMASKVRLMLEIVQAYPQMNIRIVSGEQPNVIQRILVDPTFSAGTLLAP